MIFLSVNVFSNGGWVTNQFHQTNEIVLKNNDDIDLVDEKLDIYIYSAEEPFMKTKLFFTNYF